jgi:UDP-N-acetylglucosamine--N-acetylmuramyl-(pentapeptide) pyrophosphoryl-undecaprenol N-acetylglucosamine transferase
VQFLARVATVVAVSFDEVVPYVDARRVAVTGYPVRPELLRWAREEARDFLELPDDARVVLVLGGSQGARSINDSLAADLPRLLEHAYVVHASGAANYPDAQVVREGLPEPLRERYRLYPYLDAELAPAMNATDLVVTRAGASTLGELPNAGLPGILIPYPHAGAHQWRNARFLADRGAAVALDDAEARNGRLLPTILDLLNDPARLAAMAAATRSLARPDAARHLFELVSDVATTGAATAARR